MKSSPTMSNCFSEYSDILEAIEITTTEALDRMTLQCENALTTYSDAAILNIFHSNLVANAKKYAELIALYESDVDIFAPYHITETYTDTRTPELISTSQSTGSGASSMSRNQSHTATTTPATTTTTSHQVNPYDNAGLRVDTQESTTDSGNSTTVDSYSGSPDTTTSSSAAATTTTSGGSEVIEHELTRSGRDGRFSISQIIEDAELAAPKLNIIDQIIQDLADQIFLQVW